MLNFLSSCILKQLKRTWQVRTTQKSIGKTFLVSCYFWGTFPSQVHSLPHPFKCQCHSVPLLFMMSSSWLVLLPCSLFSTHILLILHRLKSSQRALPNHLDVQRTNSRPRSHGHTSALAFSIYPQSNTNRCSFSSASSSSIPASCLCFPYIVTMPTGSNNRNPKSSVKLNRNSLWTLTFI